MKQVIYIPRVEVDFELEDLHLHREMIQLMSAIHSQCDMDLVRNASLLTVLGTLLTYAIWAGWEKVNSITELRWKE
jgi:hypothetical protein